MENKNTREEEQLELEVPVKKPPAGMRVRKIGEARQSKVNMHSTGKSGVQLPLRLTRNESELLEGLLEKYQEKYHKVNRSRFFRAAIHLCSNDTRARNLLLKYMRESL